MAFCLTLRAATAYDPLVRSQRPSLAVACVLLIGSCSFVAVKPLTLSPGTTNVPECTSSRVAPVVDVTAGSLFAVAFVGLLALGDPGTAGENAPGNTSEHDKWQLALIGSGLLGAGYLVGAYRGFSKTSECRAAKDAAVRTR